MTYSARLHDTCIGMETTPGNPCRCCCDKCVDELCPQHIADHDQCLKPKRYWWYDRDSWEWDRWQFFYTATDEFCNRTIVLRLWKPLVIVRNRHLRSESCDECFLMAMGASMEAGQE